MWKGVVTLIKGLFFFGVFFPLYMSLDSLSSLVFVCAHSADGAGSGVLFLKHSLGSFFSLFLLFPLHCLDHSDLFGLFLLVSCFK